MSDAFDTALFIMAVLVIMAIGLSLIKGKFDWLIFTLGIAVIYFILLSFYDRAEGQKVNEEKLAETRDKWQDSKVTDR